MIKDIKEIVLIFASYKEVNSLLYQSSIIFKKIKPDYYIGNYKNLQIKVYICGIGYDYVNSFLNNFEVVEDALIIKVGTCAVIDPSIDILLDFVPKIVSFKTKSINITNLEKFDLINEIIKEKIIDKKLFTIKFPLINKEKSEEFLNIGYSFVDMETFYFIEKFKNSTIFPLIIGTDRGDGNAKRDFLNNISKASNKLKDSLMLMFKKIID